MIVYALYSNYFDGCDFWESIVDLYISKDLAEFAMLKLNASNSDIERQSYFIRNFPVITG